MSEVEANHALDLRVAMRTQAAVRELVEEAAALRRLIDDLGQPS